MSPLTFLLLMPFRFHSLFISIFVVIFNFFALAQASAQQNRLEEALFVSLPISAQGENEARAKERAKKLALRAALAEALHRFVVEDYRSKSFVSSLSDKQITSLTEGFFLERVSFRDGAFYGQASVRFLREKFFARLHKANLKISYTVAPTFLLLPILEIDGATQLWPPQNSWLSAWKIEGSDNDLLVPVISAEMTPNERVAILDSLKDLQSMQAALLIEQYRAQGIAVVTAKLSLEESSTAVPIAQGVESSEQITSTTAQEKKVPITLRVDGMLEQTGFPNEFPSFTLKSELVLAEDSRPDLQAGSFPSLLLRARNETLARLNRIWKEETAHSAKLQRLSIIAELQNREQWEEIRQILAKTPELIDYNLRSLSTRQAHVTSRHYSSLSSLISAFERRGLRVLSQEALENASIVVSLETSS